MSIVLTDDKYIWHPLTQHRTAAPPLGIVRAQGALLFDEEGKTYIDGIASWYTSMYGHGNKHINEAVTRQLQELDFVMFSGFTHPPAVDLAQRLMEVLPKNQAKIFFNDNGSTAIEAAIKMALQYHRNKGDRRKALIAFEGGFHGDTLGAMSVSGLASYNGPFEDFLLDVVRLPVPTEGNLDTCLARLGEILDDQDCAAFVFEPLVQGAAGMKFLSAKGLDVLIQRCQERGVICIADEIMTGFGKTGKNFASDFLETPPDIMCLGKALTAGVFPLSITSCSQKIFDGFLSMERTKGFFHAHTFSGHPLGCAAALAGLELLNSPEIQNKRSVIAQKHARFVERVKDHPKVANARSQGVILAIDVKVEAKRYGDFRDRLYRFFMEQGVVLRPLGNTIYTLPPYVIKEDELQRIYDSIENALNTFL